MYINKRKQKVMQYRTLFFRLKIYEIYIISEMNFNQQL